jgi:putative ABC transport system permease protein
VTPGYFETFGVKITRGRNVSDADRQTTTPVAVVSESMARHFFGSSDPLRRTFVLGGNKHKTTIVGVVQDVRHEQLRSDAPPRMVYLPLSQIGTGLDGSVNAPSRLSVAIALDGDPAALASTLRSELKTVNRDAIALYIRTMEQQIDATLIPERLLATLSSWFAGIALLLACVGLYGVMTYNVSRRKREIGLRIALGAFPRTIVYRVLREALTVSAFGIAVGLSIALATTRLLSTFLFGVLPRDTATLALTAGVLVGVAILAGFFPARRAAAIDPVGAFRDR